MNYVKIYENLMRKRKFEVPSGYTETHHIIPTCLGGTDCKDNLVKLTPEEHYVAHLLLIKIHPNEHKLVFAAHKMCQNRNNNKLYGWLRRRHAEAISKGGYTAKSGKENSQFGTQWITNDIENKKVSKTDAIPNGWKRGRTVDESQKLQWITNGIENKMVSKTDAIPNGWKRGYGDSRIWITNGILTKKISTKEIIPEGWVRGYPKSRNSINGKRMWITNGREDRFILVSDLIPEGWKQGRKIA